MKKDNGHGNAKDRIVEAAVKLFSKKGYDGARVDEIARAADVNKALIYYYFPSKQTILNYVVNAFFDEMTTLGMGFIQDTIVSMIEDGSLDILPDRMRFSTVDGIKRFKEDIFSYCKHVLRYMIDKRDVLRIILSETLRGGEQGDALFRFFMMAGETNNNNPFFAAISSADSDFTYSTEVIFRKFYFALMPMINFVVFYEEYQAASGLGDDELLRYYLRALDALYAGYFSGQDLMMETVGDMYF